MGDTVGGDIFGNCNLLQPLFLGPSKVYSCFSTIFRVCVCVCVLGPARGGGIQKRIPLFFKSSNILAIPIVLPFLPCHWLTATSKEMLLSFPL